MRPQRIVAAVDFSDRSCVALGVAARLACRFGAELRVLHAHDPLLAAAAESRGLDLAADTEQELRLLVAAIWPAARCTVQYDVTVGPAAAAIAGTAERERADLIVMAAHGLSAPQQALLGSTTEAVLRRAAASVLVVPDDWAPADADSPSLEGEGPVVVGVDFKMPSIEAAAAGTSLARSLHTDLVLVHVVPAPGVLPRWREHAEAAAEQRTAAARQRLEDVRDTVGADVGSRLLVTRGRPASCLAEAGTRYPHAILAIGRTVHPHGYALLGRTAFRVVATANVPVLVHVAR
jgi:nucleotide-binding universal stress UspA family protein